MADEARYSTVKYENADADDMMQGASPKEQILEAARRNNTELLHDVFNQITKQAKAQRNKKPEELLAEVLNGARDGIGMGALHIAAQNGNCKTKSILHV
jgi:hypothetical protein